MPEYGDVEFNLTDLRLAPLLSNNTYGGSVSLVYGNSLSFGPEAANDDLMSYGMLVERLAVLEKVTGQFQQGAFDATSLWIMTGATTSSSGTTPSRQADTEILLGGSGLPYFGVIGNFASLNGANVLIGLRKIQLDTFPEWKVDANKFRISETNFTGMAIDTTTRKAVKMRRYETAVNNITDFNVFFA